MSDDKGSRRQFGYVISQIKSGLKLGLGVAMLILITGGVLWLLPLVPMLILAVMMMPTSQSSGTGHRVVETWAEQRYYRMVAEYRVLETEEIVKFDRVVRCEYTVSKSENGTVGMVTSRKEKPYEPHEYMAPGFTKKGNLVVVGVPRACDALIDKSGNVTRKPRLGAVFPKVTWFDDGERMDFGWMYAHEKAYRSPAAKIAFLGARLEPASVESWERWRRDAEVGFRPRGRVQNSMGFLNAQVTQAPDRYFYGDDGWQQLPDECRGLGRLDFRNPLLRSALFRARVGEDGALWPIPYETKSLYEQIRAEGRARIVVKPDLRPQIMGGQRENVNYDGFAPLMSTGTAYPWHLQQAATGKFTAEYSDGLHGELDGFLACTKSAGASKVLPEQYVKGLMRVRSSLNGELLPWDRSTEAHKFLRRDESMFEPVREHMTGGAYVSVEPPEAP